MKGMDPTTNTKDIVDFVQCFFDFWPHKYQRSFLLRCCKEKRVAALWSRQTVWALLALLDYAGILLLNAQFLSTLYQARGVFFLLQCFLFLPVDLWISGLGALWAILDYLRGNRY